MPCATEKLFFNSFFSFLIYNIEEKGLASVFSQERSAHSLFSPEVLQLPWRTFLGSQCVCHHIEEQAASNTSTYGDITHGMSFHGWIWYVHF